VPEVIKHHHDCESFQIIILLHQGIHPVFLLGCLVREEKTTFLIHIYIFHRYRL